MILDRFPWVFDVVTIVVVVHVFYTFIWQRRCCKKAKQAYAAAHKIWDWVNDGTTYIKCMLKQTGCDGSDPTWPPDSLGTFPPPEE